MSKEKNSQYAKVVTDLQDWLEANCREIPPDVVSYAIHSVALSVLMGCCLPGQEVAAIKQFSTNAANLAMQGVEHIDSYAELKKETMRQRERPN